MVASNLNDVATAGGGISQMATGDATDETVPKTLKSVENLALNAALPIKIPFVGKI